MEKDYPRILFMGTPAFAISCMEMILRKGYKIIGLICQPDKRQKRISTPQPCATKIFAVSKGVEVYQPKSIKSEKAFLRIKEFAPDLICVVAYGQIIPLRIIEIPRFGCINAHASLLPRYRGAAPIQWSIIKGEKETGVTTFYLDEGMDTGDIILKRTVKINDCETAGELSERLSVVSAELLLETIDLITHEKAPREKQVSELATYAPKIDDQIPRIDWSLSKIDVSNLINGLSPQPGTYSFIGSTRLKIFRARPEQEIKDVDACPGKIILDEKGKRIFIKASDGLVELLEMQLEGKKRLSAGDFLRGYRSRQENVVK